MWDASIAAGPPKTIRIQENRAPQIAATTEMRAMARFRTRLRSDSPPLAPIVLVAVLLKGKERARPAETDDSNAAGTPFSTNSLPLWPRRL